MRALDLFCGAGGSAQGLHEAGFEVIGVDTKPQRHYPFEFHLADALSYPLDGFDLIWASPPCQRYSMFSRNLGTASRHPDLLARVRSRLLEARTPYVIENVIGAPLLTPVLLCGSMFGLGVQRHRLLEAPWLTAKPPSCNHDARDIWLPCYGKGTPRWHAQKLGRNVSHQEKSDAMGISWMSSRELPLAIPPAFSKWIGEAFRDRL